MLLATFKIQLYAEVIQQRAPPLASIQPADKETKSWEPSTTGTSGTSVNGSVQWDTHVPSICCL